MERSTTVPNHADIGINQICTIDNYEQELLFFT